LYLGIAISAAGIQRMIHLAASAGAHHGDGAILGVAIGLVMLSMIVILDAGHMRLVTWRVVGWQLALAMATVGAGLAESMLPPVLLVFALAALCASQLVVTRSAAAWGLIL
jgi:energy-converting hydrogenase Eha subunit G